MGEKRDRTCGGGVRIRDSGKTEKQGLGREEEEVNG